MSKTLTKLSCALFLSGMAFAANAEDITIEYGKQFEPLAGNVYNFPGNPVTGTFTIESNSGEDLCNDNSVVTFMKTSDGTGNVFGTSTLNDQGYYVYTVNAYEEDLSIVMDSNPLEIKFKVFEGDGESDGDTLGFGSTVTSSVDGPNVWYIHPAQSDGDGSINLLTNSQNNVVSQILVQNKAFYENNWAGVEFEYEAVLMANGCYAYNATNQFELNNDYVFVYSGNDVIEFTFSAEPLDGTSQGGGTQVGTIDLGDPFTANAENPKWVYQVPDSDVEQEYYLTTNSTEDLAANGELTAIINLVDMLDEGWEPIVTSPDGYYVYSGKISANTSGALTINYTGDGEVLMTLGQGLYDQNGVVSYMEEGELLTAMVNSGDPNATVDLTWDYTNLTFSNLNQNITYTVDGGEADNPPLSCAEFLQLITEGANEPGLDPLAEVGETGNVLAILLGNAGDILQQPGEYTFNIPAGVVKNDDGEYNPAQSVTVEIYVAPLGEVSPADGTEFMAAQDEIEFTVSYGENVTVVKNTDAADAPLVVTNYGSFDETYTWDDSELSVVDNEVVINLGDAIPMGNYEVTLREGAVLVNGTPNESQTWNFTVVSGLEDPTYTLTPDPANGLESLSEVTLVFSSAVDLSMNASDSPITLVYGSGDTSVTYYGNAAPATMGGKGGSDTWIITFLAEDELNPNNTETLTTAGEYKLTIPAPAIGNVLGDFVYMSKDITVTYYILSGDNMALPALYVEQDPVAPALFIYWEEEIFALGELNGVLTTPDETEVDVTFNITNYTPGATEDNVPSYNNNALILPLGQYVAEYGSGAYQISFGEIVRNAAGDVNIAMSEEPVLVAAAPTIVKEEVNVVLSPESITLNWGFMLVSEYNPDGADILIMEQSDEMEPAEYRLSLENGVSIEDGFVVVIDLEDLDLTVGQKYELTVPAYYFYVGETNEANDEVTYIFTYGDEEGELPSTGVSSLEVEALQGVYNLQGVKVGNSLEGLAKGLYIVNGKKVLVK